MQPVHVAHIRYACAIDGADIVGKSMKPDDWRTLPLCAEHHLEGSRAQHRMNEMLFWSEHGINPYAKSQQVVLSLCCAASPCISQQPFALQQRMSSNRDS